MSGLKQGSMRQFINNIYTKLREDEELMRLLHYKPANYSSQILEPLDKSLPNIVGSDEYWDIVDQAIITGTKTSDIQEKGICRIYIYAGRRRPKFQTYASVDQEVILDVFVHESFNKDLRLDWLGDRINELIALEYVAGYGKLEYAAGNSRVAPIGYSMYEHVYKFASSNK